ncbi:MAG: DNA mismatch repair protein MutS [Bacteroidales bacterium]|nr:DNA mismatch repair protein MutS [Bacteroidales bacterium]
MKEKIEKDKGPALTPMMKQFFDVKAQHPEALLLFRCGDFYETYGSDAEIASKVLGIILTRRSNAESIPMAGVPYHAIDNYLPKLVRAGYKVAICDQLEDPKLTKNIVKRGVTELVTPGVALNEQLLSDKENNFVAGLCFEKDSCGVAFLDISTGTFRVAQGPLDYVATLLSSFSAKEIVVPKGYEKGVRDYFGDQYYVSTLDEWAFVYDSSVERIKTQVGTGSLKGFGVEETSLGVCSAGALLVYLEQTHHTGLKNICSLSRIDRDDFVWMDRFTLRNLEVFASAAGRDGRALVDVVDMCASPMGARLLRSWLSMPIMDLKELESRFDTVGWFLENPEALAEVRDRLSNIGDQERLISRAAAGRIEPRAVVQLRRGLGETGPIAAATASCPALEKSLKGIDDCSKLIEFIDRTLCEAPAAAIGKGDVIGPGVNKELDELREISRNGKQYLIELEREEAEKTGISSLKIGYNNVFGYYFEVRNAYKDQVPEEWTRKQTLVNAERYITPELKEYEEKILGAEDRIYVIETGIYQELVARIQREVRSIQKNCRILARIDVLANFAEVSTERGYNRPVVDKSTVIDLKGARHPVIETLMAPGEEYIPNDVFLDSKTQQIMILTGPNMAGKSALLRQTALIVLLAQSGCFVPADSAHIGYCDKIFTRVGASDNISRGESTFMVEMLETSTILHNVSARSLILLDEIGRGTSTFDGMSIARAIVEYLHEKGHGAKTLFATHYHELNDMEGEYPRVKNYHVSVKEVDKDVIFLRKLEKGGTSKSFGIHVARMAGMPREVVESAERTLKSLEKNSGTIKGAISKAAKDPARADEGLQLSFFQLDDPMLSEIREDLDNADINNMTPLQAFDLLRGMKEKLGL